MAPDPDHSSAAGRAGSGGDLMERAVDGAIRLGRAWKALSRERRSAAIAATLLWLSLFLPWYQASVVSRNPRTRSASPIGDSLSGWAAFSGVEALILILSLGTLLLLFLRAEGRLSWTLESDGWGVTVAGALSVFLVVLGLFNAPSPASRGQYVLSTGLQWGIFLALLAAIGLTWAGGRMRRSLEEDPILAGRRRPGAKPAAAGVPGPSGGPTSEPSGGPTSEPSGGPAPGPSSAPFPRPSEGSGSGLTGTSDPKPEPGVAASPPPSQHGSRLSKPRAKPAAESLTEANRLGVVEPLTDETRTGTSEPPADKPTPGAGKPLTAAAAQRPRPVRAPSASDGADQTAEAPTTSKPPAPGPAPAPAPAPGPPPAPAPAPAPASGSRSDWRPAESPAWKDPERPRGWLTASRPSPSAQDTESESEATTRQHAAEEPEQLTIPLDSDE